MRACWLNENDYEEVKGDLLRSKQSNTSSGIVRVRKTVSV
jgi:hypothetical protein